MITLICKICNKEFKVIQARIKTAKYCSRKCLGISKIGKQTWKFRKRSYKGELNPAWKGNGVGYQALHTWIHRNFGKANRCENDISHESSRFEWANISGRYLRDISDWKQLCKSCHSKHDNISKKMSMIRKDQETLKFLTKFYLGKRTEPTYIHDKRYSYL